MLETGKIQCHLCPFFLSLHANPVLLIARGLTLEAAQSATASSKGSSADYSSSPGQVASSIKKLLESRHDREVLDGMRKVISVRRIK